jgi:hypothetical protein
MKWEKGTKDRRKAPCIFDVRGHRAASDCIASKGNTTMKTAPNILCLGLSEAVRLFFSNGQARADYIYVANYGAVDYNHPGPIERFDSNGNASIFTTSDIFNPGWLAFDGNGNLYVSNYAYPNGTIEKFDSSGLSSLFA